jgi:hypothetical protein
MMDVRVYIVAISDDEHTFEQMVATTISWDEVTQTPVTDQMADAIIANVVGARDLVLP